MNDAIVNWMRDSKDSMPYNNPVANASQTVPMKNYNLTAENFYLTIKERIKLRVINPCNVPIRVTGFKYIPRRTQTQSATTNFMLEQPANGKHFAWGGIFSAWSGVGSGNTIVFSWPKTNGIYNPTMVLTSNTGTLSLQTDPVQQGVSTLYNTYAPFLQIRQLGAFRQRFPPRYFSQLYLPLAASYIASGYNQAGFGTGYDTYEGGGQSNTPGDVTLGAVQNRYEQPQSVSDRSFVKTAWEGGQKFSDVDWSIQTAYKEKKNFYIRRYFKIRSLGSVTIPVGGSATFKLTQRKFTMQPIRDNMMNYGADWQVSNTNQMFTSYWTGATISGDSGTGSVSGRGMTYPIDSDQGSPAGAGSYPTLCGPEYPWRTIPVSFNVRGMYGYDAATNLLSAGKPMINRTGAAAIVEETYTAKYKAKCRVPRHKHHTEVNMLENWNTYNGTTGTFSGGPVGAYSESYPQQPAVVGGQTNPIQTSTLTGVV